MEAEIGQAPAAASNLGAEPADASFGRIVSVTGAKAIFSICSAHRGQPPGWRLSMINPG
jgi:hypothetical protein